MAKDKKPAATATTATHASKHEKPSEVFQHAKKGKKAQPTTAAPPAAAEAAPAAAQDSKPGKKRAAKDEIDAIFASGKKASEPKPQEQLNPELQQLAQEVGAARQAAQASGKRPKIEGSKDDIFGEAAGKSRKRTEEGYAVYSEEELGLGKRGGETALCPFDCDCCF